jgi:hypothetical protein
MRLCIMSLLLLVMFGCTSWAARPATDGELALITGGDDCTKACVPGGGSMCSPTGSGDVQTVVCYTKFEYNAATMTNLPVGCEDSSLGVACHKVTMYPAKHAICSGTTAGKCILNSTATPCLQGQFNPGGGAVCFTDHQPMGGYCECPGTWWLVDYGTRTVCAAGSTY